jgi:hypothetical protein
VGVWFASTSFIAIIRTNKLSLSLARAHYKFLNPCHRCHLAKLFSYQAITGNNEVATVTTIGDFDLKMSEKTLLLAKP